MSPRSYDDYFQDIYDATSHALAFTEGVSYEHFAANTEKQYAVLRALEIIGEAARQIPDGVQRLYPALPWREMIAMRNVVIHDYFGVDQEVIWRTVREDLPDLKAALAGIVRTP
jgi:uncharacterized protein with HEPN domain